MSVCPVCNGLREVYLLCANCGEPMLECGKLMDYYDDYSPYMEIDLMKLEDGYSDNHSSRKCAHFYRCPGCQKEDVVIIKE
ncbi:hypothetical protein JK635_23275 [Neobacillus sp. YIM B02564]|uniref:Uncharacterized protein n=1 Tax=Neobacillus paridis TaxID=2803862 RepID=A0ABS1TV78_9BACI|nr:hypothetical protein [Neobacillus paridis]MBL4955083.1 hypothetical protein [Neobacillus paridis]